MFVLVVLLIKIRAKYCLLFSLFSKGDSGGPLLIDNGNNNFTQIGIVSFGFGCGQATLFGIYERVANHQDFIASTIQNRSNNNSLASSVQVSVSLLITMLLFLF